MAAEPSHLDALLRIRRARLSPAAGGQEREHLLAFYHKLRKDDELGHAEAQSPTLWLPS